MQYQMEPMTQWPFEETKSRLSNPFKANHEDTLSLLDRELTHLGVRGAVAIRVVTNRPDDVRRDGMLRSNAKVLHPGVALSFVCRHGALTYPCDTFASRWQINRDDWQLNLRAIALALEALRKVSRYGVGSHGEQYTGWRAIESSSSAPKIRNYDEATAYLRGLLGDDTANLTGQQLWRAAARRHHVDVGGDAEVWQCVQRAGQVLGVTVGLDGRS